MHRKQVFRIIIEILAIMALTLILGSSAGAAGKYKTLHKFKQTGVGGSHPSGGLILDANGNLYGVTEHGGDFGYGTVFELTPNEDGSWRQRVLHSFRLNDGRNPGRGLIFDAAGDLYGTTVLGGAWRHGTVFELKPNGDGSWAESILHSFNGSDGRNPASSLIFDAAGNLYGTTYGGGAGPCGSHEGCGTVFKLTPSGDGSWTESVLHSFNGSDGRNPASSLIFDAAGNLYGTTTIGPSGGGMVFELTPNGDGSWTESVLHSFDAPGDLGDKPFGGLIFDAAGNLYGTTLAGGEGTCYGSGCGTVFKLAPNGDGSWTHGVLYTFKANGSDGNNPNGDLIFDAAGNLYGTTWRGGSMIASCNHACGTVFKLTPKGDGSWIESVLHRFIDRPGFGPEGGLVLDQAGDLLWYDLGRRNNDLWFGIRDHSVAWSTATGDLEVLAPEGHFY